MEYNKDSTEDSLIAKACLYAAARLPWLEKSYVRKSGAKATTALIIDRSSTVAEKRVFPSRAAMAAIVTLGKGEVEVIPR